MSHIKCRYIEYKINAQFIILIFLLLNITVLSLQFSICVSKQNYLCVHNTFQLEIISNFKLMDEVLYKFCQQTKLIPPQHHHPAYIFILVQILVSVLSRSTCTNKNLCFIITYWPKSIHMFNQDRNVISVCLISMVLIIVIIS